MNQNVTSNAETTSTLTSINNDLKSVRCNIEQKVEQENEQVARHHKALNICIYNIPESEAESPEQQFSDDISKLEETLAEKDVVLDKTDVKTFFRAGTEKSMSRPRPIIIKLSNQSCRTHLLKLRYLKFIDEQSNEHRIFINPDRTKKEREQLKQLSTELKAQRANGGQNLVIRNGKIVTQPQTRFNPQLFLGQSKSTLYST